MSEKRANQVVIVDTSCANISSLKFAIERLGFETTVTADTDVINAADKVFLPGVGSAAAAMQQIHNKGLVDCIRALTQPVLGICLGMQLLTNRSEEANESDSVDCLSLVNTEVNAMQSESLRLPHMGWNQVHPVKDSPLFHGIEDNSYFYFVHGFCVPTGEHTIATCDYTKAFSAAIQSGNFMGVQFHPERSGKAGAQLIQNFIERV